MRTFYVPNAHAAIPEVVRYCVKRGVALSEADSLFRSPVPIAVVLERPFERVQTVQDPMPSPIRGLFSALATLARRAEFYSCGARYTLPPNFRKPEVPQRGVRLEHGTDSVLLQTWFDVSGRLVLGVTGQGLDIVRTLGLDSILFSLLHEAFCGVRGYTPSHAYYVVYAPYCDGFGHERVGAKPTMYVEETAPDPVFSIPFNRWVRELSALADGNLGSELSDPFLERTVKPLIYVQAALGQPGPDRWEQARDALKRVGSWDLRAAVWAYVDQCEAGS